MYFGTRFFRLEAKTLLHSMAVIAALKHCATQNRSFSRDSEALPIQRLSRRSAELN